MLKPLGPITRADGIVLKGYMLATDLEVHDPILLPDNVVSAVNNLPSGRPAIARRLSRILYTADLPVHLIGNVASRLMELMRTGRRLGRRLQSFLCGCRQYVWQCERTYGEGRRLHRQGAYKRRYDPEAPGASDCRCHARVQGGADGTDCSQPHIRATAR